MESPPSFSTHSEAPPLSEDSGLLITSGSFSSDSASGWQHAASEVMDGDSLCEDCLQRALQELDRRNLAVDVHQIPHTDHCICCNIPISRRSGRRSRLIPEGRPERVFIAEVIQPRQLQESDFDERSLSLCESTETSERMCGDFFNTVKKGPGKAALTTIEPPPEFQDNPNNLELEKFTTPFVPPSVVLISESQKPKSHGFDISKSLKHTSPIYPRKLKPESLYERRPCLNHRFASPRLLHLSPCRGNRPSSRNSLTSRLSSSHNSLVTQFQADDSSFITQAISHDTLTANTSDITDMYNVPFDSDIYAVPIDTVWPCHGVRSKGKKPQRNNKKRGKSTPQNIGANHAPLERTNKVKENNKNKDNKMKRHSLPSSSCKKSCTDSDTESLHLTLREMRRYLHTLYSSSSDSECRNTIIRRNNSVVANVSVHNNKHINGTGTPVFLTESNEGKSIEANNNHKRSSKTSFCMKARNKKHNKDNSKDATEVEKKDKVVKKNTGNQSQKPKLSPVRVLSINLKQSFCNLFRWRRQPVVESALVGERVCEGRSASPPAPAVPVVRRALPPLPAPAPHAHAARRSNVDDTVTDFATSIQIVKDYGWYWGPISVEAAEKILSNEPDGSFIVRDSSDDHYIFTLTFKLNGMRHVRIEHDQGNFCFGGCTMFKAQTIVEFIENAVETSRSGRYLFFLNLRPVLGPVRVQLLYPVSRFKRVQSLQHMCRFVILKYVRRDLITSLPLPRRLLDYLNSTHYYSELLADM